MSWKRSRRRWITGTSESCCNLIRFECLYGVTPFQQESEEDTKNFVLSSHVIFPTDSYKRISPECKDFIIKLLEKDVAVRGKYTVDQMREHSWLQTILRDFKDDETIFEVEQASAHREYQQIKGRKIDGTFVDYFVF